MMPSVAPGDVVVLEDLAESGGVLRRGEIVAIRLRTRARPLLKRIVAQAGDRLTFDRALLVNNAPPRHPYTNQPRLLAAEGFPILYRQLGRVRGVVPPNSVVVLGDNRSSAEDSRMYGLVSRDQILGKVVLVLDRDARIVRRRGIPEPATELLESREPPKGSPGSW